MYHVNKVNERQLVRLNSCFGKSYVPGMLAPYDHSVRVTSDVVKAAAQQQIKARPGPGMFK
jgi:hypothetical protein